MAKPRVKTEPSDASPPAADSPLSFEASIAALGQLVEQLERGDLPLEESLNLFERGIRLSKDAQAILEGAKSGDLRVLLIVGSEDAARVLGEAGIKDAVAKLDALIVVDTNRSALTDAATVVLPGLVWAEKDGSFTNHAGRVQRIRQAMEPHAGLEPEGALFARLAALVARSSAPAAYDAGATLREIAAAVPAFAGIGFDTLGSAGIAPQEPGAAGAAEAAAPAQA